MNYTYYTFDEKRNAFQSILDGSNPNYRDDPPGKLRISRYDPPSLKGQPITGLLASFPLPGALLEQMIENIGSLYGGGRYHLVVVSVSGKYITGLYCDIAGLPKMPPSEEYN